MIVFSRSFEIAATSGSSHIIKSTEIKGGVHTLSKDVYLENKDVIDQLDLKFIEVKKELVDFKDRIV